MKVPLIYHENYSIPFPTEHRFVMAKFRLISQYLREKNILTDENLHTPSICDTDEVLLVHDSRYVDKLMTESFSPAEIREMGLPFSSDLVNRVLLEVSGTILAGELALKYGLACNLGGGTHHAHHDKASGFCLLNDIAIAIRALQNKKLIQNALIVDLDVHQGDGNSAIFQNDNSVFVFSMHGEKNFPIRKVPGTLDIGLETGMGDTEYLDILCSTLPKILDRFSPDLVFYDAGVDVYSGDILGRLSMSEDGIKRRDRYVLDFFRKKKIPVATVIGGGYDTDHIKLAARHSIIFEVAQEVFDSGNV